jgi:hypothetical protein
MASHMDATISVARASVPELQSHKKSKLASAEGVRMPTPVQFGKIVIACFGL